MTAVILTMKEGFNSKKIEKEVVLAFIHESVKNLENLQENINILKEELKIYRNGQKPLFAHNYAFEHEVWDILKVKYINRPVANINFRAIELLIWDSLPFNSLLEHRKSLLMNLTGNEKEIISFDEKLIDLNKVLIENIEDLFKILNVKIFQFEQVQNLEQLKRESTKRSDLDFSNYLKPEDLREKMDITIIYQK
mgnify:CR=1 FL=1